MYRFILLLIPVFIYADDLYTLIEFAKNNNDLIRSSQYIKESKSKQVDSKISDYFPTVDIGGYYQGLNEPTPNVAGDIYSGYVKVGFDIYDGGRKSALLESAKNEYKASCFDRSELENSLKLQITQDFFTIRSLRSTLKAKEDSNKLLSKQLQRVTRFYSAGLSTSDDVDRLQAAFDTNLFEIESLKFQLLSAKKRLELKVGKNIDVLEDAQFQEKMQEELELSDSVNSLIANQKAVSSSAESIDSIYYPQIKVEDTYSVYDYDRVDTLHPEGLKNQNMIMVSANMRLFDFASAKESKAALKLSSEALKEQVKYKTKEQKLEYELSLSKIKTSKIKIESAKSALISAENAFTTIEKKYKAGIVDYIVYLDALSAKTDAVSLYESSLNELQIAYATYYYYSGKDLEEYIK